MSTSPVVQAALHGAEILGCNMSVGDVCSGSPDVDNPSRLCEKIRMRTQSSLVSSNERRVV